MNQSAPPAPSDMDACAPAEVARCVETGVAGAYLPCPPEPAPGVRAGSVMSRILSLSLEAAIPRDGGDARSVASVRMESASGSGTH